MWVARSKDGTLQLFKTKPVRCSMASDRGIGVEFWDGEKIFDGYDKWIYKNEYFNIEDEQFNDLTWEDEPIEIELVPKMINAIQEKLAESVDDYVGSKG